ncbi:MAG: hypothetical protein JL50_08030 [Peptococcaceae bacterium BICA1-7]|nr:MAG: hypothetical protein JL50_08030 [Peptococcaceae bacterium BICA1-7]HBV97493.1 HD domain-containing protein [Desulfotomaculum sp.]
MLEKTIKGMYSIFGDDHKRINHALEVLKHSLAIYNGEFPGNKARVIVELAAVLHDIGIKQALVRYKSAAPVFQHREGPPLAKKVLEEAGADPETTARVLYIVGNHHHRSKIDGPDFQALWEADLIANLPEFPVFSGNYARFEKMVNYNFKTRTGRAIALSLRERD